MESKSDRAGNELERFRALPSARRLTPQDILFGARGERVRELQRQAGMNKGTYVVSCDLCRGQGYVRFGLRPMELCHKCDGDGVLTIMEPREAEKRLSQWKAGIAFIIIIALGVAVICGAVIFASLRH